MSRWQKKSKEEKQAILDNQNAKKQNQEIRSNSINKAFDKVSDNINKNLDDKDKWTEIVNSGDIPIFCPIDGWVGCNKYELKMKSIMPGTPENIVAEGNCKVCQRLITKVIDPWSGETMIIMILVKQLERENRLVDLR